MVPCLLLWHLVLVSCRSGVIVPIGGRRGETREGSRGTSLQTASPQHHPPGGAFACHASSLELCTFPLDLEPDIFLQKLFSDILGSGAKHSEDKLGGCVSWQVERLSAGCPQEIGKATKGLALPAPSPSSPALCVWVRSPRRMPDQMLRFSLLWSPPLGLFGVTRCFRRLPALF